MPWRAAAAGAVVLLLFGPAALAQPTAAAPTVAEVRIKNYQFVPGRLVVNAGTTVRWVNDEKRASHSIWFKAEGLPESDRLFKDETWERRFDMPGSYPYTCGPHPEMHALIEVRP